MRELVRPWARERTGEYGECHEYTAGSGAARILTHAPEKEPSRAVAPVPTDRFFSCVRRCSPWGTEAPALVGGKSRSGMATFDGLRAARPVHPVPRLLEQVGRRGVEHKEAF